MAIALEVRYSLTQANWKPVEDVATTIKADMYPPFGPRVFGYTRRNKGRVKVSSDLAQDH